MIIAILQVEKARENTIKETGLSYIQVCQRLSAIFKMMFMNPTKLDAQNFYYESNSARIEIIKAGQNINRVTI